MENHDFTISDLGGRFLLSSRLLLRDVSVGPIEAEHHLASKQQPYIRFLPRNMSSHQRLCPVEATGHSCVIYQMRGCARHKIQAGSHDGSRIWSSYVELSEATIRTEIRSSIDGQVNTAKWTSLRLICFRRQARYTSRVILWRAKLPKR